MFIGVSVTLVANASWLDFLNTVVDQSNLLQERVFIIKLVNQVLMDS
jgi:hypothetical protein